MTGSRCVAGAYSCQAGGRVCSGGVTKSPEVCNGFDDDCNGPVDDVPGIGSPCTTGGVNTKGECSAVYTCAATNGGGPSGLTCTQQVAPKQEVCNGLDDNCDGTVDNAVTDVGVACAVNCPGGLIANCKGECKAGATICSNGAKVCANSTGPTVEICDGLDNDCNGIVDDVPGIDTACTGTGIFTQGACRAVYKCTGTAGAGPNGLTCTQTVGKQPETCNGVDDDCDGNVDNSPSGVGGSCGLNCPGRQRGQLRRPLLGRHRAVPERRARLRGLGRPERRDLQRRRR